MRCATYRLGSGLALLMLGTGAALAVLIQQRPAFYDRCAAPDGRVGADQSADVLRRCDELKKDAADPRAWVEVFTTEQINSFLRHELLAEGRRKLPPEFNDVRVQVDDDLVRIGFRYGGALTGAVVSLEARVTLADDEENAIDVELGGLRAGALPLSRDVLFDAISKAAAKSGVDLIWRYRDDQPVARLRFRPDGDRPRVRVERLDVRPGRLLVAGTTAPRPASPSRSGMAAP